MFYNKLLFNNFISRGLSNVLIKKENYTSTRSKSLPIDFSDSDFLVVENKEIDSSDLKKLNLTSSEIDSFVSTSSTIIKKKIKIIDTDQTFDVLVLNETEHLKQIEQLIENFKITKQKIKLQELELSLKFDQKQTLFEKTFNINKTFKLDMHLQIQKNYLQTHGLVNQQFKSSLELLAQSRLSPKSDFVIQHHLTTHVPNSKIKILAGVVSFSASLLCLGEFGVKHTENSIAGFKGFLNYESKFNILDETFNFS